MAAQGTTAGRTSATTVIFDRDEGDLIMAAGCSLDRSPKSNWVEEAGGLPEYICRIARAVKRTGKTTSQAVAIAVSRVKKWAAGADDVNADTRAKAAKALAQWEALKVKSKAKGAAKELRAARADLGVLCLAKTDYNVDLIRSAFEARQREARKAWREANPTAPYDDGPGHLWIKEQWTSYVIVQANWGSDAKTYKISFAVGDDLSVTFGEPVEVRTEYVVVDTDDITGAELSDAELQKLLDLTEPATDRVLRLAAPPATAGTGGRVERVLALAAGKTGTAATRKPYGSVTYADPGYRDDKVKRYPIDTTAHVRAAWSYINQADNAAKYSPGQLASIKARIKAAARRHGITISDD